MVKYMNINGITVTVVKAPIRCYGYLGPYPSVKRTLRIRLTGRRITIRPSDAQRAPNKRIPYTSAL